MTTINTSNMNSLTWSRASFLLQIPRQENFCKIWDIFYLIEFYIHASLITFFCHRHTVSYWKIDQNIFAICTSHLVRCTQTWYLWNTWFLANSIQTISTNLRQINIYIYFLQDGQLKFSKLCNYILVQP